jgi:hypothetical protein
VRSLAVMSSPKMMMERELWKNFVLTPLCSFLLQELGVQGGPLADEVTAIVRRRPLRRRADPPARAPGQQQPPCTDQAYNSRAIKTTHTPTKTPQDPLFVYSFSTGPGAALA